MRFDNAQPCAVPGNAVHPTDGRCFGAIKVASEEGKSTEVRESRSFSLTNRFQRERTVRGYGCVLSARRECDLTKQVEQTFRRNVNTRWERKCRQDVGKFTVAAAGCSVNRKFAAEGQRSCCILPFVTRRIVLFLMLIRGLKLKGENVGGGEK